MKLTKPARQLRKNQTKAEKRIWYRLRSKQLCGHKFRRQHPIGPYIVDFVCTQEKLIVELDGGQHMDAIEYDEKRTQYLESRGYTVLRFWNNEVMENIEGVLEVIRRRLPAP